MSGPRRLAAIVVAALVLAAPTAASAQAVSGAELTALAERAAADDASARERLLAVDEVDGRPVAVDEALAGAAGDEIVQRARLIAASTGAERGGAPADARRDAQQILDARRYKGAQVPRPFAGPIAWLGDRIQPVIDWIDDLGRGVPGGPIVLWMVLAALVLSAAAGVDEPDDPAPRDRDRARPHGRAAGDRGSASAASARPTAPSATATGSWRCACGSVPACCGSTAGGCSCTGRP